MKQIFCLLPNDTIGELRNLLNTVEGTTKVFVKKRYHLLLCEEIEQKVDQIALNIMKRPDNFSILIEAQRELNGRIGYAISRQAPTAFNLQVSASACHIRERTYLILSGTKEMMTGLSEQLQKSGVDILKEKEHPDGEPELIMQRQLFPVGDIKVDPELLKFHSVSRRGMRIARHNLTNRLLSAAAQGKEIQNYQLMYFMDLALEELHKKDMESEVKRMGSELSRILPEITYDLISK